MNRKNPDLAETEPMSRDEQRHLHRCFAAGWTIAAVSYTIYSAYRWHGHHWGDAGLGWLMALWAWGAVWYEHRHKNMTESIDSNSKATG